MRSSIGFRVGASVRVVSATLTSALLTSRTRNSEIDSPGALFCVEVFTHWQCFHFPPARARPTTDRRRESGQSHAFLARFWYHLPVFVSVNIARKKCTRE